MLRRLNLTKEGPGSKKFLLLTAHTLQSGQQVAIAEAHAGGNKSCCVVL